MITTMMTTVAAGSAAAFSTCSSILFRTTTTRSLSGPCPPKKMVQQSARFISSRFSSSSRSDTVPLLDDPILVVGGYELADLRGLAAWKACMLRDIVPEPDDDDNNNNRLSHAPGPFRPTSKTPKSDERTLRERLRWRGERTRGSLDYWITRASIRAPRRLTPNNSIRGKSTGNNSLTGLPLENIGPAARR
jgi:hypothetical protein